MWNRTPLLATALVATVIGCGGSDDSPADAGSMTALLERLPLSALDAADQEGSSLIEIGLGDMLAAAELAGLARPDPSDIDASTQWYIDLAIAGPRDAGGTGYAFSGPQFPHFDAVLDKVGEIDEELGFTPFDIDAYATFSAPPVEIAVLSGDLTLSEELVEIDDGIVSAGEGEDFETVLGDTTALRQLGRPHRMAADDGLVAVSLSTRLVEAWLAGGESLTADPALAAAAAGLDRGGSVAASIFVADFRGADAGRDLASPIEAPFSVVGIGTAEVEGTPGNVIVYVFDDAAGAAASLPAIETGWRDGPMVSRDASIAEFLDVVSVEQDDRVVIVTTTVTDVATTRLPLEMLIRAEPIFSHNG